MFDFHVFEIGGLVVKWTHSCVFVRLVSDLARLQENATVIRLTYYSWY